MFTRRPRSARELVSKAGRVPTLVVALAVLSLPALAWAQAPAKPGTVDDKSKAKVAVSEHMTVDLHLKDEDLSNVLELLSIQTQKNIVASKGVTGKVTATLYGVTFYQALDSILHVNGYGYVENGNFIYVYTNAELKDIQAALKHRVAKKITLNYLNADDAKEFLTPLLSKEGGEIKITAKAKDFAMPDKAPTGKNDYALGDVLVVNDYEENIKAIEELVKQLDTRPQQVLVEATILQTSLNEANAFGVDFSIIGDVNFLDFLNTGGALSAASSIIKGGNGTAGNGVSPSDNQAHAITSTVGGTQGAGGFKAGVIAGDVGVFLRMLDTVTDTVILSNPKILALNRQPARVLVGKRVGYLNTTQTETSTTQSVQFLDTGTQLYFRPFVSADGEVRMELKPQVSSAEIRNVTDSGGHTVTIPDELTQEIVTNVNVRDGQTIVLGGLFSESSTFTRQQVPWAGDLPILGAAFRGHDDSTVRSEIIFLITPTIVTDSLIASSADRANADMEGTIRAGTRQKLLPWSRERMSDKLNVEAEALAREGKYAEANWKLRQSLSLNSGQSDAIELREKITGEREHWPDSSRLDSFLDAEVIKRTGSIPAPAQPQSTIKPHGSTIMPTDKLVPGASGPRTEYDTDPPAMPSSMSTTPAPAQAIVMPGQTNVDSMLGQSVNGELRFSSADGTTITTGSSTATATNTTPSTESPATAATPTAATPAVEQPAAQPVNTMPATQTTGSAEQSAADTNPVTNALVQAAGETSITQPTSTPPQVIVSGGSSDFVAPQPNAGFSTPTAAASIDVNPASPSAAPSTATAEVSVPTFTTASTSTPASMDSTTPASSVTTPTASVATPAASVASIAGSASSSIKGESHPNPLAVKPNGYNAPILSETERKAVADIRQTLPGIRGQIELFGLMNAGQMPNLGTGENFGWDELFTAQLMKAPPANSYVGGPNASKVVVGENADECFHTNYGWVYNPKTGKLWAAGFDASDRPLSKSAQPSTTASAPKPETSPASGPATAGVETDNPSK